MASVIGIPGMNKRECGDHKALTKSERIAPKSGLDEEKKPRGRNWITLKTSKEDADTHLPPLTI
jgi:hypothetical protein